MKNQSSEMEIVDVVGIGFGPSNMALATVLETAGSHLDCLFFEPSSEHACQSQLMTSGTEDLTASRRMDYQSHVSWLVGFFQNRVCYDAPITGMHRDEVQGIWIVETPQGLVGAQTLVADVDGASDVIPNNRVFHLSGYDQCIAELDDDVRSIAVLGTGQSAVEIKLDLMARFPNAEIHAIHPISARSQKNMSTYSDTLAKLYAETYEEHLRGKDRFHLHNNVELHGIEDDGCLVSLSLGQVNSTDPDRFTVDALIVATAVQDFESDGGHSVFSVRSSENLSD
ncbi:MAG: SidA/IucD/PvdA family monooxygenase [Paracoccaceae bacterium]